MRRLYVFLCCAMLAGCGRSSSDQAEADQAALIPVHEGGRDNNDLPGDRISRMYDLAHNGDRSGMPEVIECLNDESMEVRRTAAWAATHLVGRGVPFRADGSPERRAREIDAYRRLWARAEETNTEFLIDLVPVLLEDMESSDSKQREQAVRDVVLLTGVTFGFRGDQSPDVRRSRLNLHRQLWSEWSQPDNPILEAKRRPKKLRKFRSQRRNKTESRGNSAE